MTTEHTPGPWQSFNGGAVVGTVENSGGSTYVADIRHRANGESAANARLIAAAPDMLAALERIAAITGSTGGHKSMVEEFQFLAHAAIAKARGEG